MRLVMLLGRSLRLQCPRCGQGRLFRGPFAMYDECEACGLRFAREPGYFLGSIYVNYGVTALVVTAAYLIGALVFDVDPTWLLVGLTAYCVIFPLWFFRYARSIWMGFDEWLDSRNLSAEDAAAILDRAIRKREAHHEAGAETPKKPS